MMPKNLSPSVTITEPMFWLAIRRKASMTLVSGETEVTCTPLRAKMSATFFITVVLKTIVNWKIRLFTDHLKTVVKIFSSAAFRYVPKPALFQNLMQRRGNAFQRSALYNLNNVM